ncbi:hypothetical protein HJC23_003487 [Cyclotella cryptica]|uniref:Uncharacterized protein n=1 Tax=Cyclotella cryptica TaxID=29204 RepID=A0ABD3QSW6_9STRA|eukprot:CCRYP_002621-RA/>CCRYP_002621-RA protein AED:0.12 eAED:0.12 QI:438/1/1/1/0/0/2/213/530
MSASADKLNHLRKTLQSLSSFQLPDHYHDDDASSPTAADAFPNPELLQRYKDARDAYIHRRTLQLFVELIEHYDDDSFELPTVSNEELENQRKRKEEVLNAIKSTMERVSTMREENVANFAEFERKREELNDIVMGIERHANDSSMDEDVDTNDDQEITEEDVERQEEELNKLAERRQMLEQKLRSVRNQIALVENEVHDTKKAVNEVRVKTGRKPIDWRAEEANAADGQEVEYFSVKENVDAEVAEMQEKIRELRQSAAYYEGMRELMEELGGVKILETKGAGVDGSSAKQMETGFVITLMLLNRHILELTLEKQSDNKDGSLRVSKAKLLTSTSLPVPQPNDEETANLMETMNSISISNLSFSKIMSQKPSEAVIIPPLDDLVSYSQQLASSDAIRFVVSETMARIRTVRARVEELIRLRSKYVAQVYDIDSGEQEVVCAINEGISIALRLGADCPLVSGSVYVSELCGVGGWEEDKLQELKKLVEEKRCRGPLEVMEVLVEEIKRMKEEEGWVLPLTPVLFRTGAQK